MFQEVTLSDDTLFYFR